MSASVGARAVPAHLAKGAIPGTLPTGAAVGVGSKAVASVTRPTAGGQNVLAGFFDTEADLDDSVWGGGGLAGLLESFDDEDMGMSLDAAASMLL